MYVRDYKYQLFGVRKGGQLLFSFLSFFLLILILLVSSFFFPFKGMGFINNYRCRKICTSRVMWFIGLCLCSLLCLLIPNTAYLRRYLLQ